MPEWLTALTVGEVIAFVAGLSALWLGLKRVWPFIRRVTHFLDDLMGEPARAGVQARPGIMERLAAHEERIAHITHEVTPNHGGSMKDALKRIEENQGGIRETQDILRTIFDAHIKQSLIDQQRVNTALDSIIPDGNRRIECLEREIARVADDSR